MALGSLRSLILAAFVVLLVVVQLAGLAMIHFIGTASVRQAVTMDVVSGARAFERLLELDSQRLIEGARLLSADPAFLETAATAVTAARWGRRWRSTAGASDRR